MTMKWIIPLLAIAVALAGCTNPDESDTGGNGGSNDGGGSQVDGTVEVVDPGNETSTNATPNETNASG